MDSLARALIITHRLRTLLLKGGFKLTKWISNNKGALKTIPETEAVAMPNQIMLTEKKTHTECALGLLWNEIGVMVQPTKKPETRWGILSMVSSIYDPFSLLAPLIILGKLVFQEECRRTTTWDEPLDRSE